MRDRRDRKELKNLLESENRLAGMADHLGDSVHGGSKLI
jgi:hypothetical protein